MPTINNRQRRLFILTHDAQTTLNLWHRARRDGGYIRSFGSIGDGVCTATVDAVAVA
jgi:hypothetical protein